MPDVFTRKKRSAVMSRIRGVGNKATELRLIQVFRSVGINGWRRKAKLPGKPDFVFPQENLAVFVDGCFWHGCPKHLIWPKGNATFWRRKITRNRVRDQEVGRLLRARGWRVMRIWEHELKRSGERRLLGRLRRMLAN